MAPTEIDDRHIYCRRMQAGLYEKLFFVDKLYLTGYDHVDVLVDFGCADGSLICWLRQLWPDCRYIGYDIDPVMIDRARHNCPDVTFTSDWHEVVQFALTAHGNLAINLSSVLHEVYSYCCEDEIAQTIDKISGLHPDLIFMRDMYYPSYRIRSAHPDILAAVYGNKRYNNQLRQFEKRWGPVTGTKNLMHFLLKYRYIENWDREVQENYFSVPSNIVTLFPNVECKYLRTKAHDYTLHQVQKDFGAELFGEQYHTHVECIFEKSKE